MRYHTPLWPVVLFAPLALLACEADDGVRPAADAGPKDAEAPLQPFDPLLCTLGDACEQWGELIEEPSFEAFACEAPGGEPLPAAWHVVIDPIPCPFGTCAALDMQVAVEVSGPIVALYRVELPSPKRGFHDGGYWFTRYTRDGVAVGSQLWDYAIPPPGVQVRRRAQLLNDASGDVVFASSRAILPGDELQPLTIEKLSKQQAPKPQGSAVKTPASNPIETAIGPNGELLVLSFHGTPPAKEQHPVLTLHDRRGRVLWNRPWPVGRPISEAHIDAAGRITVAFVTAPSFVEGDTMIAQLDVDGHVIWRRSVGEPNSLVQTVIDRQGNVYALRSRWNAVVFEALLERVDALGRSSAVWKLDQLGRFPELHRGRDGVHVVAHSELTVEPELWILPFDAKSSADACEGRRHLWPGSRESSSSVIALAENELSQVYVATTSLIFKVGGAR